MSHQNRRSQTLGRELRIRFAPRLEQVEARFLLSGVSGSLVSSSADVVNQVLTPTGTPTAHQVAKTRFIGIFNGDFQIGRGRYSTEKANYFLRGVGNSNMMLHSDYLMRFVIPTDSSNPATGVMTIYDRNRSGGASLGIDLVAIPGAVDSHGRPTRFQLAGDSNLSSGTFAQPLVSGVATVKYGPIKKVGPFRGAATVIVRGSVYSNGTSNFLANSGADN